MKERSSAESWEEKADSDALRTQIWDAVRVLAEQCMGLDPEQVCLVQPRICGTQFEARVPRKHRAKFLQAIGELKERISAESWAEKADRDALRLQIC